MTGEELAKRLKGKRLTEKLALKLSIEKWEKLSLSKEKVFNAEFPISENCALCLRHCDNIPHCPLNEDEEICSGSCHLLYDEWTRLNARGKIPERNDTAKELVEIMKQKLKELKK